MKIIHSLIALALSCCIHAVTAQTYLPLTLGNELDESVPGRGKDYFQINLDRPMYLLVFTQSSILNVYYATGYEATTSNYDSSVSASDTPVAIPAGLIYICVSNSGRSSASYTISVSSSSSRPGLANGSKIGIALGVMAGVAFVMLLLCQISYRKHKNNDKDQTNKVHLTLIRRQRMFGLVILLILGTIWTAIGYSVDLIWMEILGPIAFCFCFLLLHFTVISASTESGRLLYYNAFFGFAKMKTEIQLADIANFQMGLTYGKRGGAIYRMEAMLKNGTITGIESSYSNSEISERTAIVNRLNQLIGAQPIPVPMFNPVVPVAVTVQPYHVQPYPQQPYPQQPYPQQPYPQQQASGQPMPMQPYPYPPQQQYGMPNQMPGQVPPYPMQPTVDRRMDIVESKQRQGYSVNVYDYVEQAIQQPNGGKSPHPEPFVCAACYSIVVDPVHCMDNGTASHVVVRCQLCHKITSYFAHAHAKV